MIERFHEQREEGDYLRSAYRKSKRILEQISRRIIFNIFGAGLAGCILGSSSPVVDDGGSSSPDGNGISDGIDDGDDSSGDRDMYGAIDSDTDSGPYPICPDDETVPSYDVSRDDCFPVGCFDDVVQQATTEQIVAHMKTEAAAGHDIVTIWRTESAIMIGDSGIIEAPSIFRCAVAAAFAYDKNGQIVRGLAHIDKEEGRSEETGARIFELVSKMRDEGGAVGRIYIYVFSGQQEEAGQSNLNLASIREVLRTEDPEGLCTIGFRDDLIPEGYRQMDVYSIFDPVERVPRIFYVVE